MPFLDEGDAIHFHGFHPRLLRFDPFGVYLHLTLHKLELFGVSMFGVSLARRSLAKRNYDVFELQFVTAIEKALKCKIRIAHS